MAPTTGRRHGAMIVRMTERQGAPGLVDLGSRCSTVCATDAITFAHHIASPAGLIAAPIEVQDDQTVLVRPPPSLLAIHSQHARLAIVGFVTRGTKRFNCAAPAPNARLTRGRASSIHGFRAACCGIRCRVAFVGFCKTCTVNGRGTAAVDRVTSGAWARVCRVSLRWALQIAVCLPQRE